MITSRMKLRWTPGIVEANVLAPKCRPCVARGVKKSDANQPTV